MARRNTQAPDDLMTVRETADLLRTSPNGVYVMRSRAERLGDPAAAPPAYKVGSRLLYSKSEVLRWLATQQEFDPA
jgi:predicted DNA-binding transcriptional regulator AlpA